MTIVADGTIHHIFKDATKENNIVTVKELIISVKMEEQTVKKEIVRGDTTYCEADTSGAMQDQLDDVNTDSKPTAPTSQSCTDTNVK